MQHKKNQMSVGLMVQRCHRWRQKRKQYIDNARAATDEIERERMLQMAEHYGRVVNDEQIRIDSKRVPGKDGAGAEILDDSDDDEFQDFKNS
ncbi:MAG: hypothetical protein LBD94_02160 [Rickettsiales bacterium]|jgi:hypothetical protein|nr:hypothetical protein [Rickettsiales bacterium]